MEWIVVETASVFEGGVEVDEQDYEISRHAEKAAAHAEAERLTAEAAQDEANEQQQNPTATTTRHSTFWATHQDNWS